MSIKPQKPKVLLATIGSWYLSNVAKAFAARDSLAGFWISDRNFAGIPADKYRRAWPYHLAMKPYYQWGSQIAIEKAFYRNFPFWRGWCRRQAWPENNVVQIIAGCATEFFDRAEKTGALKVVDCPNSHPQTYFGNWQRECDLWCPGENVPIPRWMFARMTRELERADLILCPSTFVRDTMVVNGIAEKKCFINPFGVNTSTFVPRTQVPEKIRFISVGTICVRKGHQYLFRAFAEVKKIIPDAELVCVGDYKTDFRLERPKWEGLYTHHLRLSHRELAEMLKTCTAFVMPSQEEGFARVLSEAMAAGLPVLASHESGATTLVQDGVEGFIVHGRDPQHIAGAMIRVASDRELNWKMGEAAYKKGAISNSWQDYGDRLLAEYARRLV